MFGRAVEYAQIDRLLDQARAGHSAALVVGGGPGVGKSMLLGYARERAVHDFTVLETSGVQGEAELGFSALAQIVAPLARLLPRIPQPQAAALESVLVVNEGNRVDRFAIFAGSLSLLAAAAEERPLLALVDDVQWLDEESRQALRFAARRLRAEGIVLLFGERWWEAEGARLDPALPELIIGGLSRGDSLALLSQGQRPPAPHVAESLFEATQGNPLALVEIPRTLSDAQLAGYEALEPLLPVGPQVEWAFRGRLSTLPDEAQRALRVAAASDSGSLDEIAAACAVLGVDADAVETAEEAGLVSMEVGTITFRHPILRHVAYHDAAPGERRRIHGAFAGALSETGRADRRTWHLAAAAVGPDEEVARALEESAFSAQGRGAYAAAASALERAAGLSPSTEARTARLVRAGEAFFLAGSPGRATAVLDQALAAIEEPRARADVCFLQGVVRVMSEDAIVGRQDLLVEARRVSDVYPSGAAMMLVASAFAHAIDAKIESCLEISREAVALAEKADDLTQVRANLVLALGLGLKGEAQESNRLYEVYGLRLFEESKPSAIDTLIAPSVIFFFEWNERYEEAVAFTTQAISSARSASVIGALPFPLATRSRLYLRTGRWPAALADAFESVQLARDAGQEVQLSYCLIELAKAEAAMGRVEDCLAHSSEALRRGLERGTESVRAWTASARGLLFLGLGSYEEAVAELEAVRRFSQEHGVENPSITPWGPELVEAYARLGRQDEAAETLSVFEHQAQSSGHLWALAAAARCRGMLGHDDSFAEALELHARTSTPFERARTELCYGERLRRENRLAEARDQLRSALKTFESLGATSWIQHTQKELRASGVAAEGEASHLSLLTPQEVQVSVVVAQGATNREAATSLFLSPKTIDFHLRNVYRKLGLRSRAELVRLMVEGA